MPWPDVLDLLAHWSKDPPMRDLLKGALTALNFEWRTPQEKLQENAKHMPFKDMPLKDKVKRDPAQLLAEGIIPKDRLPLHVQQFFYDAKHNPDKLGIVKNPKG